MTNRFKSKEYQSVKNEVYVVIAFRDGIRYITHGGVSLIEAMKLQILYQGINRVTLIVNEFYVKQRPPGKSISDWKIEEYEDLFALGSDALYPKK